MGHTPGPWEAYEYIPDGNIIKRSNTFGIRTPSYDVAGFMFGGGPFRKLEDAVLAAAAPRMLAACEAAIDWFNNYSEKNPPPVHQVTEQLVEAIWSATSEQQPA